MPLVLSKHLIRQGSLVRRAPVRERSIRRLRFWPQFPTTTALLHTAEQDINYAATSPSPCAWTVQDSFGQLMSNSFHSFLLAALFLLSW